MYLIHNQSLLTTQYSLVYELHHAHSTLLPSNSSLLLLPLEFMTSSLIMRESAINLLQIYPYFVDIENINQQKYEPTAKQVLPTQNRSDFISPVTPECGCADGRGGRRHKSSGIHSYNLFWLHNIVLVSFPIRTSAITDGNSLSFLNVFSQLRYLPSNLLLMSTDTFLFLTSFLHPS